MEFALAASPVGTESRVGVGLWGWGWAVGGENWGRAGERDHRGSTELKECLLEGQVQPLL